MNTAGRERHPQDSPRPTTTSVLEPTAATVGAPPDSREVLAKRRVAIVVCHGMGQQVAFETLECLAETLRRASADQDRQVRTEVVRLEQMADQFGKPVDPVDLRRAEIDVGEGKDAQRVHLYEAYWAPITEGQVSLKDVFWFLLTAGIRGTWQAVRSWRFDRWMFGKWVAFSVPLRTPLKLIGIVVVLASLAVINGILVGVLGARLAGRAQAWPGEPLFQSLSSAIAIASIGFFGIVAGIALVPKTRRLLGNALSGTTAWLLIYAGLGLFVWSAVACLVSLALVQLGHSVHGGWPLDLAAATGWKYMLAVALIWGPPIVAAWAVRWALVQYVGDVVAYISAHSVSRYAQIRKAIQDIGLKVASAVYGATTADGKAPLYTHVIVLGHSLGSVVAYDALNELITKDRLEGKRADVLGRTALFLTFGSPLNKTAYLFRTQRGKGSNVRETMAAAIQPLISTYENRTMPWINIFSINDWIGGKLEFYDTNPPCVKHQVVNEEDKEARTPLLAHNEHWNGTLLGKVLSTAILGTSDQAKPAHGQT